VTDVRELVENGSKTVIIGRGQNARLEVASDALEWLRGKDISFEILDSSRAVDRYNALSAEGVAVGALIHSTC
jgi:hypothetical protein